MPTDLEDLLAAAAPLPGERPDLRRIWRRGRRLRQRRRALVGVPLVLALVAVPLVVLGAPDGRTVRFGDVTDDAPAPPVTATPPTAPSPTSSAPASAPATLLDLAAAAASAPASTPGAYHYARTVGEELVRLTEVHGAGFEGASALWSTDHEQWTAADGSVQAYHEITDITYPGGESAKWAQAGGIEPPEGGFATEESRGPLRSVGVVGHGGWPSDAEQLRAALLEPADPRTPEAALLLYRSALLLGSGADRELRGAVYRVLAEEPGLGVETGARDRVGRTATVISVTAQHTAALQPEAYRGDADRQGLDLGPDRVGPLQRYAYLVDPATGRLLGWESVLLEQQPGLAVEVPFVTAHATVLADGFVDSLEATLEPEEGPVLAPPDAGGLRRPRTR